MSWRLRVAKCISRVPDGRACMTYLYIWTRWVQYRVTGSQLRATLVGVRCHQPGAASIIYSGWYSAIDN